MRRVGELEGNQRARLLGLTVPLTCCVALDKSFHLYGLQVSGERVRDQILVCEGERRRGRGDAKSEDCG